MNPVVSSYITDEHMALVAARSTPGLSVAAIGPHIKSEGQIMVRLARDYLDDPTTLDAVEDMAWQAITGRNSDDAIHRASLLAVYAGKMRREMERGTRAAKPAKITCLP